MKQNSLTIAIRTAQFTGMLNKFFYNLYSKRIYLNSIHLNVTILINTVSCNIQLTIYIYKIYAKIFIQSIFYENVFFFNSLFNFFFLSFRLLDMVFHFIQLQLLLILSKGFLQQAPIMVLSECILCLFHVYKFSKLFY